MPTQLTPTPGDPQEEPTIKGQVQGKRWRAMAASRQVTSKKLQWVKEGQPENKKPIT